MQVQEKLRDAPRLSLEEGRSLSDQVYDYLSTQLERGVIGYGDRLNIKQIASELNVSSMPIRDAIKRLEQEHIVEINPRSNCFVRVPRKQDILDAIDARRMIEHFAVSSLYPHVRLSALSGLDSIVETMREVVGNPARSRDDSLNDYIELDRRFHYELCALTENSYVMRFYTVVNMHLSMSFSYGMGVCHGVEETLREHELIVHHIKGHSAEALEVLDRHLMQSRNNILGEQTFLELPD